MISEDGVLCIFLFLVTAVWKLLFRYILADAYLKVRNATNLADSVKTKLGISLYKLYFSVSAVCLGMFVLYGEKWIFRCDMYRVPLDSIPLRFRVYYIYEICFYMNELVTIFFEPRKNDFTQLVLHHIATLLLLHLSFTKDLIKYGMLILLLHDISHPLLEFSKIENYLGCEMTAEVGFFVFMTVFTISRLLVFPRYLVWTPISDFKRAGITTDRAVISVLLIVLQIMHIIWTWYILAILMRIINGEKSKDIRE